MDLVLLERMLDKFGLPIVVTCVMAYVLWRVAIWLGAKIFEPLTVAHISLIEHLKETQAKIVDQQERLVVGQAQGNDLMRKMNCVTHAEQNGSR
jgi:hypothetical protein